MGEAPVVPKSAAQVGKPSASQALDLDIVLSPRDPAGLNSLALSVSTPGSLNYRKFISVGQFAAQFGQSSSGIQAADAALRSIGLTAGRASANGLVIPVKTTIEQAQTSLHTTFSSYKLSSGRVAFANNSAPELPSSLASMTTAVLGLNNLATPVTSPPTPRTAGKSSSSGAAQASGPKACSAARQAASQTGGWTYPQLASAYSINGLYKQGLLGAGTRVALFELQPWSRADIAGFQQCYGTHSRITPINVDGGPGAGQSEIEAELDIETIIGLAPRAQISVYNAPGDNYVLSTVDEYTKIFDDDNAQVVSSSYGLCESVVSSLSPGLMAAENTLFEQAATEGMSVFAASGDSGSEGCYRVDQSDSLATLDPSSQPFVTGVGGTTLTSISTPPTETVWNDGVASDNGADGGGISSVWPMPAYQSGVIGPLSSGVPCGVSTGYCREVPDVSASADPVHGYLIFYQGQWIPVGGTSAATPLWGAMTADILSKYRPPYRAGFLNPLLYSAGAGSFNDITVGNNDYTGTNGGKYPATTGYDMASGLGTPAATAVARDIWGQRAPITFTDAPGTDAPPPYLGKYKIKPFTALSCSQGQTYAQVAGPTGKAGLNPGSVCEEVGSGWATWSHGYTGDVYWDDTSVGSTTTLRLTLPAGTRAFYFYAEPDQFATFIMQATTQSGATSGPIPVAGSSGAQYYGFYSNGPGQQIKTITIVCQDDDFAVGEFGIAK